MAVLLQKVREVAVPPEPKARPAWWDFVLCLGFLLMAVPLAVLQGFLFGESDPEKYRPFAPGNRKDGTK